MSHRTEVPDEPTKMMERFAAISALDLSDIECEAPVAGVVNGPHSSSSCQSQSLQDGLKNVSNARAASPVMGPITRLMAGSRLKKPVRYPKNDVSPEPLDNLDRFHPASVEGRWAYPGSHVAVGSGESQDFRDGARIMTEGSTAPKDPSREMSCQFAGTASPVEATQVQGNQVPTDNLFRTLALLHTANQFVPNFVLSPLIIFK